MSLKKNIVSNYIGQFYVSIIGIVILPLYSKILGAEAFGVVAFFSVIQAAFAILDLGLSPTISRETVRFRAGSITDSSYTHFIRSVSFLFVAIAAVGFVSIWLSSGFISSQWVNASSINADEISICISIMGAIAALRWYSALYRGVLIGYEKFVWLNVYNVLSSTMRYLVVIPLIVIYSDNLTYYFLYQAFISVLEILVLKFKASSLNSGCRSVSFNLTKMLYELRFRLGFTSNIAFTSVVWLLIVNLDKIFASSTLSLAEYGHFIMVVSLASGLMLISSPISSALLPRLTSISESEGDEQLFEKYSQFTKLTINLVLPVCWYMIFFAESIISVWTQSQDIVVFGTNVLMLYAIGYVILIISSVPYRLQYAKGNLRYHSIAMVMFLFVHAPSVFFFTTEYGALGSAVAWVLSNFVNFCFMAFYVHPVFINKSRSIEWLIRSVLLPLIKSFAVVLVIAVACKIALHNALLMLIVSGVLLSLYMFFFQIKKGLLDD